LFRASDLVFPEKPVLTTISVLGRRSNGSGLSGVRNTSSKSGGEQHALSDRRARNHNSGTPLEVAINVQSVDYRCSMSSFPHAQNRRHDTVEDRGEWDKTNDGFDPVQKVRLPRQDV
jgi:hypothetical protein